MPLSLPRIAAALALAAACVAASVAMVSRDTVATLDYTVLDGSKHTTAHWQGRVVVVNFWATTCAACVKEMPQLAQTYQKFRGQGLEFLAVAMRGDPPAFVVDYAEAHRLPFPVAIDHLGSIAKGFGDTTVTPTTFVINKHGEVVKRYVGEPDFGQLERLIAQLLADA